MDERKVIPFSTERTQDDARTLFLLRSEPWRFSSDEFDALLERFGIDRAEAFDLELMRLAHRARTCPEAAFLYTIFTAPMESPEQYEAAVREAEARYRRTTFKAV
ncbi:hypothetical protein [Thermomonas alba]|uniref:hypothetical protein n=1 Tax=Thermomonas alba TaxID=2888525 RepID=UPI001F04AC01|nr:hypothetical protein [Thermomonas alba]